MTDRLSMYNGALRAVGERKLRDLNETYEPRYLLDDVWSNDMFDRVLQRGQWDFATRSTKLEFDPGINPDYGYQYAFAKPDDFVRTTMVCEDEYYTAPMLRYTHEAGFWFCDLEVIYIKYVSNDSQFGGDMSNWPPNFTAWVETWMGKQILPNLSQAKIDKEDIAKEEKLLLKQAKNTDAQEKPAKFPPSSSWTLSRGGRSGGDRGSRNRLIG